ncbi:class I SAM-dependent DNA methyltransferase [Thermococcus aciditolerans]|nr:class I SAM-dependent methyltransferase [Thermococcus aciditolerans]
MKVYEHFAYLYVRGRYSRFSEKMAEILPMILEKFDARPHRILDVACGEGTFAVEMAKRGFQTVGVDISSEMLKFAKEKAKKENVDVKFICQDMRSLDFDEEFDLVTCWFDSLNYLLTIEDLEKTFAGIYRALKEKGLFIFDMNTRYGLAVGWSRYSCHIEQETEDILEIHQASYDFETDIATLRIIGFIRNGETWIRLDEEHKEKGYTLREIRERLRHVGFKELACWGNIKDMSEPQPDSRRVFFVVQK